MTHSDVPDAFTVGFVVTGESFTGHDARVCDQVASTVEDGPEREYHTTTINCNSSKFNLTRCTGGKRSHTESIEAEPLHTHFYIHTENHTGTVRLCSPSPGRFPVNSPGSVCFFS